MVKIASGQANLFGFNSFTAKLERHINDVKQNKGYLTKSTSAEVKQKQREANSYLASTDPKAMSNFSSLAGSLRYDRSARFVNGVSQASKTDLAIKTAVKNGEKQKAELDELVKQMEDAQNSK